ALVSLDSPSPDAQNRPAFRSRRAGLGTTRERERSWCSGPQRPWTSSPSGCVGRSPSTHPHGSITRVLATVPTRLIRLTPRRGARPRPHLGPRQGDPGHELEGGGGAWGILSGDCHGDLPAAWARRHFADGWAAGQQSPASGGRGG